MAFKTKEELYAAIAAGVHHNDPRLGGKTTADSLGAVLRLLAEQLSLTQTLAASSPGGDDTADPGGTGSPGGGEVPGSIKLYAGATAPANWAFCDGRLLAPGQYPALYARLGTTYGGDGLSTFALPDLRGRFALGAGTAEGRPGHAPGNAGGAASLTLSVDQLPAHSHQLRACSEEAELANPSHSYIANIGREAFNGFANVAMASGAITDTGAGAAIPSLPPFLSLHYIICLTGGDAPAGGGDEEGGMGNAAAPLAYLFQVMTSEDAPLPAVGLTATQAQALVSQPGTSRTLTALDRDGIPITVIVSYDYGKAEFVALGKDSDDTSVPVRLVGHGLPAPPPAATPQVIEFVFEAGYANTLTRTIGPRQAGTYGSYEVQNVNLAALSARLNNDPVPGTPVTLRVGDVLTLNIGRLDESKPALITLLS